MQRQPSQVLIFSHKQTGSCLTEVACRAKEQHALHKKSRKHQISRWVPLDLLTIQLKASTPDWAKLYPLNQHASDNEEEEDDLPNMWPPRVASATYPAVSHPCVLFNAVLH